MRKEKQSIEKNFVKIEISFDLKVLYRTPLKNVEDIVRAEFHAAHHSFLPYLMKAIFEFKDEEDISPGDL